MERLLAACLDFLLPRACALCGASLPSTPPWPLCASCEASLPRWPGERCPRCGLPLISELGPCMRCRGRDRAFDSAYPLYPYSGAVRELVSAYKKGGRRSLAPFFASRLAEAIAERWPERTLVPVPPRPGKLRAKGWDQVEEIVRLLEARGLPAARPLVRLSSSEQKKLSRRERGVNAASAYRLRAGASSPERPLLVDDVATTCATLEACARALREGGAASVLAVTIAAD